MVPREGSLTEKEFPKSTPARLDFRTTTTLLESYSKKRSFWWEKNWLEMTGRGTRSLGDRRQVRVGVGWGEVWRVARERRELGGPHTSGGRGGSATRSPDTLLQLPEQSGGESPRFQLLLPGPRARTSWSRRQLRDVFRAPPPLTPPEPPNRGNQTKLAARI